MFGGKEFIRRGINAMNRWTNSSMVKALRRVKVPVSETGRQHGWVLRREPKW